MRVLVTRPLADSRRTAERLAELGHEAVIAPLFEIHIIHGPELDLAGIQAVLATSANGIRALARRSGRRDISILAVGTETAAAARREGFGNVACAFGGANDLARVARNTLHPESGALLHARGANSSPELVAELTCAGFETRSCVLYETLDAPKLPEAAASILRDGRLDAVLVFSPRSARLLTDCVTRAGLSAACERLCACCISAAAAEALHDLTFAAVRTANHPDQESLLALLDSPNVPAVEPERLEGR